MYILNFAFISLNINCSFASLYNPVNFLFKSKEKEDAKFNPPIKKLAKNKNIILVKPKNQSIEVNDKATVVYKLLFAPLKIGVWENVMLHIYNDRIGEFLYKLKLISESQPIITSEVIKAELGKYTDYPIILENPTMEEIEVKYTNNNKKLFQVLQEKIKIN